MHHANPLEYPLREELPASAPVFPPPEADLGNSAAVHQSWRAHFRGFTPGARLLDIAAGIGALALIAGEVSRAEKRGFEIHGLDRAATLQTEALLLDGIRFHAGRYDQSTPFEDAYFDGIAAQWAAPAEHDGGWLAELRRILQPGGRLRFTFHARQGAEYEQSLARIRAVDRLLDEFQILAYARWMFETAFTQETALKRDPVHSAELALGSQGGYENAARRMREFIYETPNPAAGENVLQLIAGLWERRGDLTLSEILARLDRVEAGMRAAQARLRAVRALAVDESRAHRIARQFQESGFSSVKVRALKAPGRDSLLGWDLLAV